MLPPESHIAYKPWASLVEDRASYLLIIEYVLEHRRYDYYAFKFLAIGGRTGPTWSLADVASPE